MEKRIITGGERTIMIAFCVLMNACDSRPCASADGHSRQSVATPSRNSGASLKPLSAKYEHVPSIGAVAIPVSAAIDGRQLRGVYLGSLLPAASGYRSGLRKGDVILSINDNVTGSPTRVNELIEELSGKTIRVTVARRKLEKFEVSTLKARWTFLDAPDSSGNKTVAELEQFAFVLINNDRKAAGLSMLQKSNKLSDFARSYAENMSRNKFFSHTDSNGADVQARAACAGLSQVEENLAFQKGFDLKHLVRQCHSNFMDEPANQKNHRGNILDPANKTVGVGVAVMQEGGVYVVQEFSRFDIP